MMMMMFADAFAKIGPTFNRFRDRGLHALREPLFPQFPGVKMMARRRVRAGGAAASVAATAPPNPVPGDDGAALARIVDYFRHGHEEAWERLRLCPLQHGLEEMARLLSGVA